MRRTLIVALALLAGVIALSGLTDSAVAEKRVALVVGNSGYQYAPKLTNPRNDAADIAAALKKDGFQVIEGFDLDKAAFDRKVRDFAVALKGADAGVLFYAGHGLQVAGQNYLVPIDAKAEEPTALEFEMLRVEVIHRIMEQQTNTNILFLDACRDNPLARNLARNMGTRSTEIGSGLARIETGVGTLISFSTQPGNVALDGAGRNSPFAGALVKQLSTSNDDLSAILIAVRNEVMQQTQRKQVPWENSALTGRFYFNTPVERTALPNLPTGARPAAFTGESAGGLFTRADAERVRALAEKYQLLLPPFQIEVPDADVPANLRRFIGVWIYSNSSFRPLMIIATRVGKDGKFDGYWAYGPPGRSTVRQYPGSMFQIAGTITGNTLRYANPSGDASYQITLTSSNKMNYAFSSTTGETATAVFDPVWTLVQAEQLAKKK
jgi:uncharacterized caspase-like protein